MRSARAIAGTTRTRPSRAERTHQHAAAESVRKTVQHLLTEYGTVAVVVYFAIFFAVLFGFWAAIRFGWRASSTAASVGTWTAAYVATKLTQPIRIAATVALTPAVAKAYERLTRSTTSGAADTDAP